MYSMQLSHATNYSSHKDIAKHKHLAVVTKYVGDVHTEIL